MFGNSLAGEVLPTTPNPISPQIGGTVQQYRWVSSEAAVTALNVVTETIGSGSPILLLPAFSTVSTRTELHDLAQGLAQQYEVTVIDWPGFGDSERPKVDYSPEFYRRFLVDFVQSRWSEAIAVVAAGHAAGYVIELTAQDLWSDITLVAPTWRGPLAVMGVPTTIRQEVKNLVRLPLIGQFLYYLNTRPSFLRWMYERHVVVDASILTPDYIQTRYCSTQQPGARYAPAAFVTGGLDPVTSQNGFKQLIAATEVPITVMIAQQAPFGSKSGMEAIAALPNVASRSFAGSLGMAEELGAQIATAILES